MLKYVTLYETDFALLASYFAEDPEIAFMVRSIYEYAFHDKRLDYPTPEIKKRVEPMLEPLLQKVVDRTQEKIRKISEQNKENGSKGGKASAEKRKAKAQEGEPAAKEKPPLSLTKAEVKKLHEEIEEWDDGEFCTLSEFQTFCNGLFKVGWRVGKLQIKKPTGIVDLAYERFLSDSGFSTASAQWKAFEAWAARIEGADGQELTLAGSDNFDFLKDFKVRKGEHRFEWCIDGKYYDESDVETVLDLIREKDPTLFKNEEPEETEKPEAPAPAAPPAPPAPAKALPEAAAPPPAPPKKDPPAEVDYTGVPPALADLMRKDGITPFEVQAAVAQREYFPMGTPWAEMPSDFIDGVLIGAWEQVKAECFRNRKAKQANPSER